MPAAPCRPQRRQDYRALNDTKIPCPAAADRAPDGTQSAWTLTSVQGLRSNPRYTGRQVWNPRRTDHELLDHAGASRRPTPQHPGRVGDIRETSPPATGQ
ncbi:recombinase family protein [Yinghuangia sp. ASG 101]|uniref:recombinase family protein n=1 Tax=Yinghuangia sp. ASG 101 TaxID=2896848 RepID=UPI003FCE05F3